MYNVLSCHMQDFAPAGIEHYLIYHYTHMDTTQLDIDIYIHGKLKWHPNDANCNFLPQNMNCRIRGIVRSIFIWHRLTKLLKAKRYDVVHVNSGCLSVNFTALMCARLHRVPICISHSHNTKINAPMSFARRVKQVLARPLQKAIRHNGTVFMACSVASAQSLFGDEIDRLPNLIIAKNGIDISRFTYNGTIREYIRKALLIEQCFVIGHVGRLTEQKNQVFLLEIFRKVLDEHSNSKLIIAGDGELEEQLRQKARELKVGENVIFLGARDDVDQLMQAMDVFVLPSAWEGLGIVNIEAQAAGLKTIVSDAVPMEAKVTDLIEYLPLSVGAEEWARVILRYKNGYIRRDTSAEIKEKGYDIHETAKQLEAIYMGKKINTNND